ncbi:hypothetical protein L596_006615 [Steinernema carpocapsae]|uniref:Uncharacterized protein n=1 Tax=Steinernema carpocapsae TaxID=34508 RepID=A0A4U8VBQ7_STECR|nr:hypothetical protein L596_006615 [Steinernema carpocapsae]
MDPKRVEQAVNLEAQLYTFLEQPTNNPATNSTNAFLLDVLNFLRTSPEFLHWKATVDNSFAFLPDDVKRDVLDCAENLEPVERNRDLCYSFPQKINSLKNVCQIDGAWGRFARQATCNELKDGMVTEYFFDEHGPDYRRVNPNAFGPKKFINFTVQYPRQRYVTDDQLLNVADTLYGYLDLEYQEPKPVLIQKTFPKMVRPFSEIILKFPGPAEPKLDYFLAYQISLQHLRTLDLNVSFSKQLEPHIAFFVQSANFEIFKSKRQEASLKLFVSLFNAVLSKTTTATVLPLIELRVKEATVKGIKMFLYDKYKKEHYLVEADYRFKETHEKMPDKLLRVDIGKHQEYSEVIIWMSI